MSMDQSTFHFTIGPVQGFVAQARRTRDFWAGSFILSWLAAVAMKAVEKQGGSIIFPVPDNNYLAWLEGIGNNQPPRQGSIPNRFKAQVPANFDSLRIVESVHAAWRGLAEVVWKQDLGLHCADKPDTRSIWDRQVNGFWEINWVFGDESNLLDRRKNWRSHPSTVESGIKCMVMEGWQELSGVVRPNAEALKKFWNPIREACQTDLAEGEHLCAIAFVKRRFARCFEKVRTSMPGEWTLRGWPLQTGVPSVMYMAAVHWLEQVIQREETTKLIRLHETARQLIQDYGEWDTDIHCISKAYQGRGGFVKRLAHLDGSVFFEHVLENRKLYSEARARTMKQALGDLAIQEHPTPFYAILLMDGDSLGIHMGDRDKQPKISRALDCFTRRVEKIVYENNGFLVYAGGDDVLALLPLEDALNCAAALRRHYLESFEKAFGAAGISTLSGAIEYAHVKMPLTRVLKDAHELLDDVAKDDRGRDAIAVRVWKPGGKALEWAMPWDKALQAGEIEIQRLAAEFSKESSEFSNKFFYKIHERFELLNPEQGGQEEAILTKKQASKLLAVDYLVSGVNEGKQRKLTLESAVKIIDPLLIQCRPVFRKVEGGQVSFESSKRLEVDGALLVRFLAQKGVEQR